MLVTLPNADAIASMLERRTLRQAGFDVEVTEAANGQEALDILRTGSFNAVRPFKVETFRHELSDVL